MEFPNAGIQCSVQDCKQLDFLPFTCNHCQIIFCKEHFPIISHSCIKFTDNIVDCIKITSNFECSQDDCTSKSLVEMPCFSCKNHFCLLHRHHACFESTEMQRLNDMKKWKNSKTNFLEAKNIVDKEVINSLRKSKNVSIAMKVQLMKLKSKSTGPNNVSICERFYFLVHPPITGSATILKGSKGVFVSINWSIGKVIDSIAESLNIPNYNNQLNSKKLRLYNYFTGNIITNKIDTILNEIINNNNLLNGQDIILEYFSEDVVNCSSYK